MIRNAPKAKNIQMQDARTELDKFYKKDGPDDDWALDTYAKSPNPRLSSKVF